MTERISPWLGYEYLPEPESLGEQSREFLTFKGCVFDKNLILGTKFSVNYGGGIKVRHLLGPIGINVDVRGYTIPDAHDGTLHILQTSAGLVFTW